eukprot:CAMPEP_0118924812 /NCGR_PEP_ID=MMETSP1169-20130426/2772_1 /TAXON_ID=36882 /ORGANISM="Pyramimonas obovata, Strain CCMP722" /LENGTH=52 /DNA_ID=CAMNT_0006865945 /DNA_START=413 /DNA_END=567 /DNA_ORIENTATION=+
MATEGPLYAAYYVSRYPEIRPLDPMCASIQRWTQTSDPGQPSDAPPRRGSDV